jgi:predicted DNA-binding protein YlxM (UPF0122 family)
MPSYVFDPTTSINGSADDLSESPSQATADPCGRVTSDTLRDTLAGLLKQYEPVLTAKQQQALDLVVVRGLSHQEAATQLGTSAEAIRQRIVGTRGHGGVQTKAPLLYLVWKFRNRGRTDITEYINAFRAAARKRAECLQTQASDTTT